MSILSFFFVVPGHRIEWMKNRTRLATDPVSINSIK